MRPPSFVGLRQPEVEDLHPPVVRDHDVGGFEVPVDDAPIVSRREGVGHGNTDLEDSGQRHALVGADLIETPAFDELHRQEVDAAVFLNREQGHDVWVIEPGDGLRLALEPRETLRISGCFGGQDLQGDIAFEPGVAGAVDLAHAPLAEQIDDLVVSQPASGFQRH